MPIELAPLTVAEPRAIETLLDAAFGPNRFARTAYRIREGLSWLRDLSYAALHENELVGCLQSWPVQVARVPLVLVGPVAVAPDMQSMGIGSAMMEALVEAAGTTPLVMIGDPEYYGRWGFLADATSGWTVPGPTERHRLLARSAVPLPAEGALGPRLAATALAA